MADIDTKDDASEAESVSSKLSHFLEKGLYLISLKLTTGAQIPAILKKIFLLLETIQLLNYFFDNRVYIYYIEKTSII